MTYWRFGMSSTNISLALLFPDDNTVCLLFAEVNIDKHSRSYGMFTLADGMPSVL